MGRLVPRCPDRPRYIRLWMSVFVLLRVCPLCLLIARLPQGGEGTRYTHMKRARSSGRKRSGRTPSAHYDLDPALTARRGMQEPALGGPALALAPAPVASDLPATCTIHFFRGTADALAKHLVRVDYAGAPGAAEADNIAEGLSWQGTLQELLRYVRGRDSPLVYKVNAALWMPGGYQTHGTPTSRLDLEASALHLWYTVNPAQGESTRCIQAVVTLLNGTGDIARDHLLGEELINTLHFAVELGLRPTCLPLAAVPPEEVARVFRA